MFSACKSQAIVAIMWLVDLISYALPSLSLVLQYSTPSTKNNGTVQLAAACQIRELFFFGNRHFFYSKPNNPIFIGKLAPNYQWFTGAHSQRLVSLSTTWFYFGVFFRRIFRRDNMAFYRLFFDKSAVLSTAEFPKPWVFTSREAAWSCRTVGRKKG